MEIRRHSRVTAWEQTSIISDYVVVGDDVIVATTGIKNSTIVLKMTLWKQCDDVTSHAQMITGNVDIVLPPHDFEHASRSYYRV
jgi:hypothetical protein